MTPIKHVTLIHGWSVGDHGAGTTGTLIPHLEKDGYTVDAPSYGRVLTKSATRRESRAFAKDIVIDIPLGSLIITHSNGAIVGDEVSCYLPPRSVNMIWIHPAMDPWRRPGIGVNRLLVVHSLSDWTVWLAGFVPGAEWGQMGRVGFMQDQLRYPRGEKRVTNHSWNGSHSAFAQEPGKWVLICDEFHMEAAP